MTDFLPTIAVLISFVLGMVFEKYRKKPVRDDKSFLEGALAGLKEGREGRYQRGGRHPPFGDNHVAWELLRDEKVIGKLRGKP